MTKEAFSTERALKLALEALEAHADIGIKSDKAITAIKEALAQPEQEPVGEVKDLFTSVAWEKLDVRGSTKVYLSTPPAAQPAPVQSCYCANCEALSKELAVLKAQPEQEPDTYGYAKRLAEAIWRKHYQSTAPKWEPFCHLMGVLTQIDNMTAALVTPPAAQQEPFYHLRQYGDVTKEQLDRYMATGDINPTPPAPQRKPLSDEQILAIDGMSDKTWVLMFARAVEAAHNIKENT